jgi:hypothetical protein
LMLQIAQNAQNELPCALKLQFWGHNSLAEQ